MLSTRRGFCLSRACAGRLMAPARTSTGDEAFVAIEESVSCAALFRGGSMLAARNVLRSSTSRPAAGCCDRAGDRDAASSECCRIRLGRQTRFGPSLISVCGPSILRRRRRCSSSAWISKSFNTLFRNRPLEGADRHRSPGRSHGRVSPGVGGGRRCQARAQSVPGAAQPDRAEVFVARRNRGCRTCRPGGRLASAEPVATGGAALPGHQRRAAPRSVRGARPAFRSRRSRPGVPRRPRSQ